MSRLQELVLTRMAALGQRGRPLSAREVSRLAGGTPSNTTISKIVAGKHSGTLDDVTAEGLARALQVPRREVYEAAGEPMPESRWQLPPKFDRLTQAQRRLLEDMGNALLEAYDKGKRAGAGETDAN